jgi:hypothetical protein
VALVAFTAFGCATVRAPVSAIEPAVPVEDGVPAPQVELWLESGRPITLAESEHADAEVHAALRQALSHRRADEGEQLLVVRAQGVSRTASRRSDQTAATVGMVVGAVVVVAAVIVAVVAGKGSGGGKGAGVAGARPGGWSGGRGGGVARPLPPGGSHAGQLVRPAPPRPGSVSGTDWGRPRRPPPAYGPRPAGHVWIGWEGDVRVPWRLDEVEEDGPMPVGDAPPYAWAPAPFTAPDAPEAAPDEKLAIRLPPLPPFPVEERGFWDGDALRLELTLVERASGAPLWVKRVEQGIDPRDARAVRALLDKALDDPSGWVPAGT